MTSGSSPQPWWTSRAAWSSTPGPPPARRPGTPDLELIGAQHAEIVRNALELLRTWPAAGGTAGTCEVVLGADDGCRHLLRTVPDPYGDRLALAVVVNGPQRVLDRVRKRLQAVSVDALTAGPSMTRRPSEAGWSFDAPAPDVPAHPEPGAGLVRGRPGARLPAAHRGTVAGLACPASSVARPVRAAAPGGLPRPAPPVAAPPTSRSDVPGPSYSSGPVGGGAFASAGIRPIVIPADAPPPRAPTGAAADEPRPPSPPAALPAPAPPRSPRP